MTATELAAVEALLLKMLPDPVGFAERVLGDLAERLVTAPTGAAPNVVPGYEASTHEALVDRNVLLAAALGSCDCWGEDAGCPGCGGRGSAGWLPPDPELYTEFVAPAIRRISSDGPPADASSTRSTDPADRGDPAGTGGRSRTDERSSQGEAR